jgi:hypothetical protein
MFNVAVNGQPISSFDELCPGFTAQGHLHAIAYHPWEAIERSGLAAATAFYNEQRKQDREFFYLSHFFVFKPEEQAP